jgi:sortase A
MSASGCPCLGRASEQPAGEPSKKSRPHLSYVCLAGEAPTALPRTALSQRCLTGPYWLCDKFRDSPYARAPAAFSATVARSSRREAKGSVDRPSYVRPSTNTWRWAVGLLGMATVMAVSLVVVALLSPDPKVMALAQHPDPPTASPATVEGLAAPAAAATETDPTRAETVPSPSPQATPTATPWPAMTTAPTPSRVPSPTPSPTAPFPTPTPVLPPPDRLVIQAIDLDTPVVPVGWHLVPQDGSWATEWDVASHSAGWHNNSAAPGDIGNVVLSGHHNIEGRVFRDLVSLQAGDEILLYAGGAEYQYRVSQTMILPEKGVSEAQRDENARWIGPFTDRRLTLITCWPYDNNTHRLIVVAQAVEPSEP